MNLSFRVANPSDAELLGRLNFQLIRDEGHRNPMSESELVAPELRLTFFAVIWQGSVFGGRLVSKITRFR